MAKGKTTPFKDSKFLVQMGVSEDSAEITAATMTNPATVTATGTAAVRGDIIHITGLTNDLDGEYAVSTVEAGVITLAGTDWTEYTVPAVYAGSAAVAEFSSNFCEATGVSKTGGTIDQNDVSTICSTRKEYEAGLADSGTLQVNFNYAPATEIQSQLMEYERSGEKFWQKLILPRNQGTMLYYGGIQTGMNMDGAVGGSYTSGVTIQLSGDYYHVKVAA